MNGWMGRRMGDLGGLVIGMSGRMDGWMNDYY